MTTPGKIGEIAMIFTAFRDNLKIYHWQTHTYSRHIATDNLIDFFTSKMDEFIETIQGSRNMRMKIPSEYKSISFSNQTDSGMDFILKTFRDWLVNDLMHYLKPSDTDLINIRDEMLGNVNKTIYLFSLQ